jgi:xylulokinase
MKTVLGIDLGTQSLKVVFYEFETREIVAIASSPLELDRDDQGKAEQRASWWRRALVDSLGQVPSSIRDSVRAIGVSGQQHGFVAVDAKGEVLAPVKLWCDTSTQAEVDDITAAVGGREQCIAVSGNPVLTGYTAPKIRWLKRNHPKRYATMSHILLPHDFLNFLMTGVRCMEFGDASGTGLLDVRSRTWSAEMLRAVDESRDLLACLPPLVAADEFVGATTSEFAAEYGLPAGVPVAVGGGDNMMGAIGTGNVSAGKLTMSLGSSGTLYAYSDTPIVDPDGNIAAFCSSTGGWLPLLCTMNCTIATELMRNSFGVSVDKFDATIMNVEPGCGGLLMLPFFNGERTPNLPNGRACLLGLRPQNSGTEHMLRATVEGATYALKFGIDALQDLGMQANEVVLTGGGANSRVWRQIVADICQLPVTLLQQEEGASFGAALQALWVLQRQGGDSISIEDITTVHLSRNESLCTCPDQGNVDVYEDGYRAYRRAVDQVTPLYL